MPIVVFVGADAVSRARELGAAQELGRDAAEVAVETVPPGAWEDAQAGGCDLMVVPEGVRRKRMLLADMDSTMIGQECIDELAAHAGVGERVAAITARAMNGEIGFEGALRERVSLLKGLPESTVADVLASRITLAPGGRTLVATMRAHGAFAALVSGGFTAFAGPVAAALGFDVSRANVLLADGGRFTGAVAEPILGKDAKVAALMELSAARGLAPADVIAVGDGANDLPMLKAAGMGVAAHAKPSVQAEVALRVNHADLTALLYLQGYTADEFVR